MNPKCVICHIELDNPSTNVFICPNCKREYILDYEILAYDEEIGTAHDDEAATIELEGIAAMSRPILESADYKDKEGNDDDNESSVIQREKKSKSDIKIPKYMKNSDTTKVIGYHEG